MAVTKNLADAIRRKLAGDPDLAAAVEDERFNANVATEIYQARTQAGLTQQQLAARTGMHQSAVARLENADYDGHSLKTLKRLAQSLDKRVEIRFVDQCTIEQLVSSEAFPLETPSWDEEWTDWCPSIQTTLPTWFKDSVLAR
jgi:transcriptional regulator with XRE-family HTH domain